MKKLALFCVCCLIMSFVLNGLRLIPLAHGRSYPWTDASLRSVFMLNSSNVWAVGQSGTALRWNGLVWKTVASPTSSWLQSVFMNNEADGWAVGSGGAIIHWNGTSWETTQSPTAENLYDIFMANPNEGWAVGWDGTTVHWNGTVWRRISSPTTTILFSVYIADSSDVWAVGSGGTIIHFNGTAWNHVPCPTTSSLHDIFMITPNEGWGVGSEGTIIHFNGTSWSNASSPTTNGLRSVFMLNSTEGWAVGDSGTIIRWNGTNWNSVSSSVTGWFFSVFMINDNDGWAVGDFGSIIHWDGVEWVQSTTSIYQGDLIISGDDVFVIEDERFDINGSIIVEENATLILRNASLNFVQATNNQFNLTLRNPANGNPRLLAYNSTIDSNAGLRFTLEGNSTAGLNKAVVPWTVQCFSDDISVLSISNSSYVDTLFAQSGSSALIIVQNSTIHQWQNYGYNTAPEAQVHDSTIDSLLIGSSPTNCTISGLRPGLMTSWNFIENCSVVSSGGLGGAIPNITLANTQVSLWRFAFYLSSNIAVIDSDVQAYAYNQARIRIFWHLNVHVVDDISNNVPSANVTATYPNATLAESKLTDEDGWAKLTLMEGTKNATGEYPIGIYTVEATYETYSNTTTAEMTGNQQIILALEGFIIPEFPSFLLLPLFTLATLLTALMHRRKRRSLRA